MRVVITGIGMVTSLGINVDQTWNNLIAGKSGIKKLNDKLFKFDDLSCKIAGYIEDYADNNEIGFNVHNYIPAKDISSMDRFIHLGIAAADEAIINAGLHHLNDEDKLDIAVIIGSGIGGLKTIEKNAKILDESGPRRISPFFIPGSLINLMSGHISIKYGFKGSNLGMVSACATGTHSIGEAFKMIQNGDAKLVICGGAEAGICRLGMAGFAAARTLSTKYNDHPEIASRPWDKDRDGFVMGEGAGILVLEEFESAKKRGANIYGEIIGYGTTSDAHHITAPSPNGEGAYRAMQNALKKAKISFDQIDYINAHGTSTPLGDMIEYRAVEQSKPKTSLVMSSTKSSIGHLLGAAGGVEAIFTLLSMRNNVVPPTLNLNNPEENLSINLVPGSAIDLHPQITMSNSFGFGGTNTSLIMKKI